MPVSPVLVAMIAAALMFLVLVPVAAWRTLPPRQGAPFGAWLWGARRRLALSLLLAVLLAAAFGAAVAWRFPMEIVDKVGAVGGRPAGSGPA